MVLHLRRPAAVRRIGSVTTLLRALRSTPVAEPDESRIHIPRRLFRGQATDKPLLPRFARTARDRSISNVLTVERRLLDEFSRLAVPYVGPVRPKDSYEWLAVAQHHGIPTRLLDWTGNPLFALAFAVMGDPDGPCGVLWTLSTTSTNLLPLEADTDPYKLTRTYLFRPAHVTSRIVAQDGWFTLHWYSEQHNRFIPLEAQARFKTQLEKFLIPRRAFGPMRRELADLGVTQATLFPDLSNLSNALVSRFFPPFFP